MKFQGISMVFIRSLNRIEGGALMFRRSFRGSQGFTKKFQGVSGAFQRATSENQRDFNGGSRDLMRFQGDL